MSKTQRELLILGGILAARSGILIMRIGGGDSAPTTPPAQTPAMATSGGGTPGTTPGSTVPGQGSATDTQLLAQYPLEMLVPGLSDSAVAARIRSGEVPDPFSATRGRQTRPASTTRPTPSRPRAKPTVELDDWPAGVRFNGVSGNIDDPDQYVALFSGRPVKQGDKIPGTEYVVVTVTATVVEIRGEFPDRIEVYRYEIRSVDESVSVLSHRRTRTGPARTGSETKE